MSYQRGVRPDYTVGTITLVSNSKNFTTVGASLKTATIGSGDTIMTADGRVLIISEITGQNAGVLSYPCPASAAGTNLPLRIRFQPSSSGVQGAVRDLLERWGMTGNIDALAGLETAKDMMAYFTGAGTADTTALTEWARTLLASANGAAGYAALGEIPNGQFPQRLRAINTGTLSDCDTVEGTGFYRFSGTTLNTPFGYSGILLHMAFSGTQAVQYAWSHSVSTQSWIRRIVSGVPTPWARSFDANNIIGDVSQSDGVPTGSVIQRGGNANGEFVRFADGTQYCWNDKLTTGGGSTYSSSATWVFPAGFSSRSYSGFAIGRSVNPSSADAMRDSQPYFEDVSTSQARVGIVSNGKLIAGGAMAMRAEAVGRWF